MAMGSLSVVHWLIALVVAVLLFGPKAIAGFAKGVGQSIRSFKQGLAEDPPDELRRRDLGTCKDSFVDADGEPPAQPVNLPLSSNQKRRSNASVTTSN
jgi:sec-independent protein translocase protein TatA